MEFYQLEYLCAVANSGGYNQAARHLYSVPSAVKRGVALLEDEIGVRLLQRDGRAVRLTEEGQEFVRWGRAAIASRVEMLVLRRRGFEIGPMIEQGEADFGYLPLEYCPATLHWHQSVELRMLLAIPRRHPLARKRRLTLADLSQVPLILPDREASSGRRIHRAFQEKGLEYRTLVETGDSRLLLGFVRAGLGISVLQEQEISGDVKRDLKIVDASHLFGKQVEGLAWRNRGYLPEAARSLMATLAPE